MLQATIVTNAFSAKAIHLSKRIIVNITQLSACFLQWHISHAHRSPCHFHINCGIRIKLSQDSLSDRILTLSPSIKFLQLESPEWHLARYINPTPHSQLLSSTKSYSNIIHRAQSASTPVTAAAAAALHSHRQHCSIRTQLVSKQTRSYTMSQTNVSDRTHIFGKAPTNSLRERLRQLIHRAVILPIRFLKHVLRPARKRVSAILFEGSSDEPFCMNPPSPASTSSVQIEFSPPITVRNPTFADTPIASAVISPSRFIHSRSLGLPISMQMDFGPLRPTVRNRTSRDLSLASTTTPSSSLPPVANPIFQEISSAFNASMLETSRDLRDTGEALSMQGCDHSGSFQPGASVQPTSTADNVLRAGQSRRRAGTNQLPNSRADHADATAQVGRSSRGWQNTGQSFGPLTAQEFPEPLTHSGPGSRFPDRPDLRHASAHAAESQAEDPHEPHIPAQNIQPRPELSTVEDSSAAPETAEPSGMDVVEDVAEYFSNFEDLINLDCWGKNAQERRRPRTTPSQELPNQIFRQT